MIHPLSRGPQACVCCFSLQAEQEAPLSDGLEGQIGVSH